MPLQKLRSREEPRTSEPFDDNALDIDIPPFCRTPELEEDVPSRSKPCCQSYCLSSNVAKKRGRKVKGNLHLRLKRDANAALLLLDEKPRVRR